MTFLSRPVFNFPFNWAEALAKSFTFDLRAMQIGFGPEQFAPLQTHVVRGFEFAVTAPCLGDVAWLEDFFNQLYGPATGFWLPTDQLEMSILSRVDDTHFDIANQDLASTWDDDPCQHVLLSPGVATEGVAHTITAVTAVDATTERVTVSAALPALLNSDWKVSRLLYVRLAGDEEDVSFIAEQFASRRIRVVELPLEYVDYETGERPVFLYHFTIAYPGATQHWRFTSFAEALTVDGDDYDPYPITHSGLSLTSRLEREEVTIESVHDLATNPLSLFVPFDCSLPLRVEILQTTLPGLAAPTTVFSGQIESVEPKGVNLSAKCIALVNLGNVRLPRFLLQQRCNYQVYQPDTCKLDRDGFKITGAIASIESDPHLVRVDAAALIGVADNWFAMGWIEVNTGTGDFEIRSVLSSSVVDSNTHELRLNLPLQRGGVGDAIVLFPGCDGLKETCQTKFDNFDNFGGHWAIPSSNPTVKAITTKNTGGGKK